MESLRVLDRFPPSEAYLLTLLAAHHLEMIREEQFLAYLDRGMGIANRDARVALLESAFLRAEEIDELDHYLTRKVERGPRDFRSICRSMATPSVERVWRRTRNEEARKILSESAPVATQTAASSGGGKGSGRLVATDQEDFPEGAPPPQTHAWIKAAVAIGLLLLVALAAVMPMERDQQQGADNGANSPLEAMSPKPGNMVALTRALFSCLLDKEEVIEQLRHDPNLTAEQRSEALQIAKDLDDSTGLLNDSAWFVVRYSKGSPKGYQRAFELATEAAKLAPKNGMIINTLGVAQYRLGRYQDALETLHKSDAINRNTPFGEHPADVGYLCMAYAKLGRLEDAKEEYAAFKQLLKLKIWHDDLESAALGKEVASVMDSAKSTKQRVDRDAH
jgi:Flp pilus assembly protein TadD